MSEDFTRTSILLYLQSVKNWKINYVTFWRWEKLGYIKVSSYIKDGKRKVPIYYRTDVDSIIQRLEQLDKKGIIRIKLNS